MFISEDPAEEKWLHLGYGNLNDGAFSCLPLEVVFEYASGAADLQAKVKPVVFQNALQDVDEELDWHVEYWTFLQSNQLVPEPFAVGTVQVQQVEPAVVEALWRRPRNGDDPLVVLADDLALQGVPAWPALPDSDSGSTSDEGASGSGTRRRRARGLQELAPSP